MSPTLPLAQIAAGGSCNAGSHLLNARKMQPSSGTVISKATTNVCRAVDGTYTAYTSNMQVSVLRTIMSGDAVRSMTNANVENAVVPTKSVESSTVRTNRGDR